MRNRTINLTLVALLLLAAFQIYSMQNYIETLDKAIIKKDKMIEKSATTDSVIVEKTKDYVKTIQEFNDVVLIRDGKEISSEQIIREFNSAISEKNAWLDSLLICQRNHLKSLSNFQKLHNADVNKYVDSIQKISFMLASIKSQYGINYKIVKSDKNTIKIDKGFSKADSAVLFFDEYKHWIYKEGETWYWDPSLSAKRAKRHQDKRDSKK